MTVIMAAAMMVGTMVMTVISVSSEAAVEELRRLLLLLLGCAVQVITHAHACTRTLCRGSAGGAVTPVTRRSLVVAIC